MLPLKREDGEVQINRESLLRVLLRVPLLTDALGELLLKQLPKLTGI